MEFAIHQALKTYAGGLGFLAGSYMRSAYELRQPVTGISILWKFGYYDQVRKQDQAMDVLFQEKVYGFLEETGITFSLKIHGHDVLVTAYYLAPGIFQTAPVFFLSTDIPENDYLARTISHKLYDANPETRIAAGILLGAGGARLMEILQYEPDVYHLNESHALPLAFYLYNRYRDIPGVRERLVYTNHTPEPAGNPRNNLMLLEKSGFFCGVPETEVRAITQTTGDELDYTLAALRLSGRASTVSELHHKTMCRTWEKHSGICEIRSVTNAQHYTSWHSGSLYRALDRQDDEAMRQVKAKYKRALFDIVADQCGEIYDEKICTIVFAKRFAGYKRPGLLLQDMDRFHRLVTSKERPVQIIWAGKPYPMDYTGIGEFDKIAYLCKTYFNCAILAGYELDLSKKLKRGADIWLNVPRLTHEASGTSGMTAAMNGAVNVALPDGWFPEFARDKINSFVIPPCDSSLPAYRQDELDAIALYDILETEVLPMYYDYPHRWLEIVKHGMKDVIPMFDSNRMAREYHDRLYS